MDDDEPPSNRKCSSRLPVVGEKVRSIRPLHTYIGELPGEFMGVVEKEVNWGNNGGGHYWLKFDVKDIPLRRPLPYGGIVKRNVSKERFFEEFEIVRE